MTDDKPQNSLEDRIAHLEEVVAAIKEHPSQWEEINTDQNDLIDIHGDISNYSSKIQEFKVDQFYKEKAGPQEADKYFKSERHAIDKVLNIASELETTPQIKLLSLPKQKIQVIHSSLYHLKDILNEMQYLVSRFDSHDSIENYNSEKAYYLVRFYKHYYDLYEASVSLIHENYFEKIQQEIADLNLEAGIEEHKEHYQKLSSAHRKASQRWLVTGFVFFAIAVGLAFYLVLYGPEINYDAPELAVWGNIILRGFVLATVTSLGFWCFKNYKLNKHNELINKQKDLALYTFTDFANASGKDETLRRIILGKVTGTIFDQHAKGYVRNEPETTNDNSIVSEALEKLLKNTNTE